MAKFNIGDKVRCMDNTKHPGLNLTAIYTVSGLHGYIAEGIYLKDVNGFALDYRFELVKEEKTSFNAEQMLLQWKNETIPKLLQRAYNVGFLEGSLGAIQTWRTEVDKLQQLLDKPL